MKKATIRSLILAILFFAIAAPGTGGGGGGGFAGGGAHYGGSGRGSFDIPAVIGVPLVAFTVGGYFWWMVKNRATAKTLPYRLTQICFLVDGTGKSLDRIHDDFCATNFCDFLQRRRFIKQTQKHLAGHKIIDSWTTHTEHSANVFRFGRLASSICKRATSLEPSTYQGTSATVVIWLALVERADLIGSNLSAKRTLDYASNLQPDINSHLYVVYWPEPGHSATNEQTRELFNAFRDKFEHALDSRAETA